MIWDEIPQKIVKAHIQVDYEHPFWKRVESLVGNPLAQIHNRFTKKLGISESIAEISAIGLLKGTLKYPSDIWTPEQWIEHATSEIIDGANYLHLLKQQMIVDNMIRQIKQ